MISLVVTGSIFTRLLQLSRPDHSRTLPEQQTAWFLSIVCAVLGQISVAALQLLMVYNYFDSSSKTEPLSSRMRIVGAVARLAALVK